MTRPITGTIVLGVCLFLGLATLGYLLGDAALRVKGLERTVVVKGLSEREVPADVAIWPTTFQEANADLNALFASLEAKNALVIAFLTGHGLPREEITVAPPAVVDLYAQSYGDRQRAPFRYTGSSTITVYSKNVGAVRAAMADVIELGKQGIAVAAANYETQKQTQFVFSGLSEIKPPMIEEATKNARAVAEKFAADSQSRLGKIKSAQQGQFSIEDRDSTTPYIKKVRVVSTVEYYLSD
jgi:hypothetical protein